MVVTSDPELAEKMRLYRSHGLLRKKHYWHELPGNNFRLTNLQAALAWAQLQKLDEIRVSRKMMDDGYRAALCDQPGIRLQEFHPTVNPLLWAFAVELDPEYFPQGRDEVVAAMAMAGIETRPGFVSPALMPHLFQAGPLPISVQLSGWVISLPSFASITAEEIQRGCAALLTCRRIPEYGFDLCLRPTLNQSTGGAMDESMNCMVGSETNFPPVDTVSST
jgi:dTDP-4-amino-4,6-dideoxygalactose transaminase